MSDSESSDSPKQLIKLITDTSGYVGAIIAYITLITGRLPGPFPKTAATAGVLMTLVLLWAWRWSRITRPPSSRKKKPAIDIPGTPKPSLLKHLIDPLRSTSNDRYGMPVTQRRVEAGALFLAAVFAVGWSVSNVPRIAREFNPPQTVLEPPCDVDGKALRAVIAEFSETVSNEILFEDRLFDQMLKHVKGEVQVCRYRKVVKDSQEAIAAQEATGASVLIWGRSDSDGVDVYLEVVGLDMLEEEHWTFQAEGFQFREAPHLTFLTQYSLSLIQYVDGQIVEAREALGAALPAAIQEEWSKDGDNVNDLANAYFLLGLIYEDDDSIPETDRLEQAKLQYTEAIILVPDMDSSLLNRGQVCVALKEEQCAMDDFTTLIARRSKLAVGAYINRSYIQPTTELAEQDLTEAIKLDPAQGYSVRGESRLNWGDLTGAISDLKLAVQLTPDDPYNYHSLGTAQLLSGDYSGAVLTYEAVTPYLDEDTRAFFIEDLDAMEPPIAGDAQFQETVKQAIKKLQETSSP